MEHTTTRARPGGPRPSTAKMVTALSLLTLIAFVVVGRLTHPGDAAGLGTGGAGDFLAGTSAALNQTVLSAQQQAALLVGQVNTLVSSGALSSGMGNALTAKLNAATASLNAGNASAGVNQLNAFINQVLALVRSGRLTDAQAQPLIEAADQAIASAQP